MGRKMIVAEIVTDTHPRLSKGDKVVLLKYFQSTKEYYVRRLEGNITCCVKYGDIKFLHMEEVDNGFE